MAMIRLRTRLAKRNCYAFDILDEGGEANLRRGRGTRRSFTAAWREPRKFRSAPKPLLPERSSRAVLSGALRACFLGAGLLLAGMRVLPGADRLRVRG